MGHWSRLSYMVSQGWGIGLDYTTENIGGTKKNGVVYSAWKNL